MYMYVAFKWSRNHMIVQEILYNMYVVVQFCPLFNFIFLSFNFIIIHFQTPKQRKIKIKSRIRLNHNIYIGMFLNFQLN